MDLAENFERSILGGLFKSKLYATLFRYAAIFNRSCHDNFLYSEAWLDASFKVWALNAVLSSLKLFIFKCKKFSILCLIFQERFDII